MPAMKPKPTPKPYKNTLGDAKAKKANATTQKRDEKIMKTMVKNVKTGKSNGKGIR